MRFLALPALFAAALAAGCASPHKKVATMEREHAAENSRSAEERRMRAINYGDAGSARGAEILVYDPHKKFDPARSGVGTARTFGTGGARTKDFNFEQKVRADSYATRDFSGSKANSAAERKYATGGANTRGKYEIPNAGKEAGRKTAATKEAREGGKVAATRDLHDGDRVFLGPERARLNNAIDAKTMADWRNGGRESVTYGTSVERISNLKQLSIDDVRELLNKNK